MSSLTIATRVIPNTEIVVGDRIEQEGVCGRYWAYVEWVDHSGGQTRIRTQRGGISFPSAGETEIRRNLWDGATFESTRPIQKEQVVQTVKVTARRRGRVATAEARRRKARRKASRARWLVAAAFVTVNAAIAAAFWANWIIQGRTIQ